MLVLLRNIASVMRLLLNSLRELSARGQPDGQVGTDAEDSTSHDGKASVGSDAHTSNEVGENGEVTSQFDPTFSMKTQPPCKDHERATDYESRVVSQSDGVNVAIAESALGVEARSTPYGGGAEHLATAAPTAIDPERSDHSGGAEGPDDGHEHAASDDSRPCPRCRIVCRPHEVERVFGFRTIRWSAGGIEVTALRRQSYCRQCRTEHSVAMRARSGLDGQSSEASVGDNSASNTTNSPNAVFEQSSAGVAVRVDNGSMPEDAKTDVAVHGRPFPSTERVNCSAEVLKVEELTELTEEQEQSVGGRKQQSVEEPVTTETKRGSRAAREENENDVVTQRIREPEVGVLERRPRTLPKTDSEGETAISNHAKNRRYRPPVKGSPPVQKRGSRPRSRPKSSPSVRPARDRPAPVDVRVIFRHGGSCVVSLLPHRLPGLPDQLVVSSHAGDIELLALQDEWYQDVVPDDLGDILQTGFVWTDRDSGQEWLLSGREVFVLVHGTSHRGFVSCTRLGLGQEHVILCTTTKIASVDHALRTAECANWTQLGEEDGAPSGWQVLRGVVPRKPVPLSDESDILNVLRPVPRIKIVFEGGIRLAYNTWLLGYPPTIRVYGDPEHTETALIDGETASGPEQGGGFTVPGWDEEGEHQVWCSSISKSYYLLRWPSDWTYWPAHSFVTNGGRGPQFEFCGPLVRPRVKAIGAEQQQVIQVPHANPVLLGVCPGEFYFAHPRADLRGARCFGLPPFNPVWALPGQPLHCDKRSIRVLLIGDPQVCRPSYTPDPLSSRRDIERWCRLVLDASRKGLKPQPETPAVYALWREYQRVARDLWRSLR